MQHADPEAQARAWTRAIVARDLAPEVRKAAGKLEEGLGLTRTALASPYIDAPELVDLKARLLTLLRDAGALLVLEQAGQGR
jgi:hypothetical protein